MRNVFLQTLLFLLNKILIFFCKEMKLTYPWFICKKFQKNRPSIFDGQNWGNNMRIVGKYFNARLRIR